MNATAPSGRATADRSTNRWAAVDPANRERATSPAAGDRRLRLLTLTTLFPNSIQPRHGIFVATRLAHLVRTGRVEACVVAPTPWFPFGARVFGRYGVYGRVPRAERYDGLSVYHPRYLVVPKLGMLAQPRALARAAIRTIERLLQEGLQFDAIDAHYFFPDGVAAARVAERFGKPFVVTARGSDINLIAQHPGARREIVAAARKAGCVVAVSAALKQVMVEIGIEPERVVVLRNGVDLELFRPVAKPTARRALGLGDGPLIASVGHLVPEKGNDLVLSALAGLTDATAVFVGEGPEQGRLKSIARSLGIADRTRFLSVMPQEDLRTVYSAADVLALASSTEGWPNVLLESMACGTPVVATAVGGVAEFVSEPAGRLVHDRSPEALRQALRETLASAPNPAAVRAVAEQYSWRSVSEGQLAVFSRLVADRASETAPFR